MKIPLHWPILGYLCASLSASYCGEGVKKMDYSDIKLPEWLPDLSREMYVGMIKCWERHGIPPDLAVEMLGEIK